MTKQTESQLFEAMEHFAKGFACMAEAGGLDQTSDGPGGQWPAAMKAETAAKYLDIGTTKLRELVLDGSLPDPNDTAIGGSPKHLRKNLDKYLSSIARKKPK